MNWSVQVAAASRPLFERSSRREFLKLKIRNCRDTCARRIDLSCGCAAADAEAPAHDADGLWARPDIDRDRLSRNRRDVFVDFSRVGFDDGLVESVSRIYLAGDRVPANAGSSAVEHFDIGGKFRGQAKIIGHRDPMMEIERELSAFFGIGQVDLYAGSRLLRNHDIVIVPAGRGALAHEQALFGANIEIDTCDEPGSIHSPGSGL